MKGVTNADNHIILNIDFASLLADYAGVQTPELSQGRSFRQNLKGETPDDWRDAMYYRYWTQHKIRPAHFGIRNQQHKLMFIYGDKLDTKGSDDVTNTPAWEFHDLSVDPYEDKNMYDDPSYAEIINKMKQDLLDLREETEDTDLNYPRMQEILEQYYW